MKRTSYSNVAGNDIYNHYSVFFWQNAYSVSKSLDERKGIDSNCNVILLGYILVLNAQALKKSAMRMYVCGKRRLERLLLMLVHHQGSLK